MLAQRLKQSVLLAKKDAADRLSAQLLAATGPGGNPVVKRKETPTGFQLLAMMEVEQLGNWRPSIIFEYAHPSPGPIISYDPRIVTLQY